ncbi:MAG: DUF1801 domain-containing protein [Aureispira sp.]
MKYLQEHEWEDFLEQLSEDEQLVCTNLRQLILECLPNCEEKLSYKVPFYKGHSNICYLWPSSILWGQKKTYEGVRLGFIQGYLMYDDINYLTAGTRQYVRCRDFLTVADIDQELLSAYLYDADRINKEVYQQKKAKKKNQ